METKSKTKLRNASTYIDACESAYRTYCMRITADGWIGSEDVTMPFLVELLKRIGLKCYLIGKEGGTKRVKSHYHILYETDDPNIIINEMKKQFEKFSGNSCYSNSIVQILEHAARYCLKEGHFEYQGYSREWITTNFKLSYKKTGDGEMSKDIDKIRSRYITGNKYTLIDATGDLLTLNQKYDKYTLIDATDDLLALNQKYNKLTNRNNIKQRIITWHFEKCRDDRRHYAENIVHELMNFEFQNLN